ncbi:hypothetical protein LTR84_002236 [Exophiala bonariae]|uniref:Uncharacterized protein n=1 Tax=Exophiala bonariae TaxID=1690606 RepID=A0AAV9NAX4_9EURO|nr:hypothetical protein LTR84_002236 [Exophiala bonariae]
MPPMTFNLPLRLSSSNPSSSITNHPSFAFCYADKPAALTHFLEKKSPLAPKDLFANHEFMTYIMSKEEGPTVQYENLRPALTALRPWLRLSPNGRKLLNFYKDFLQLHGQWVMAATEQASYEIHIQLTIAVYLKRGRDQKLLAQMEKDLPGITVAIMNHQTPCPPNFEKCTQAKIAAMSQKTNELVRRLTDLKKSNEFKTQHSRLLATMALAEKKLEKMRSQRKSREAAQAALRRSNDSDNVRQLGTTGMVRHLPHVEESLREFTEEEKDTYFNFNEPVASVGATG